MDEFLKEMDEAQDQAYNDFLADLGLPHTERAWDAFVKAWTSGKDWGHEIEHFSPR